MKLKYLITLAASVIFITSCHAKIIATASKTNDEINIKDKTESNTLDFDLDTESIYTFTCDLPSEINGYEVLTEFAPDITGIVWTGKKFKAPKAGKVKYSKKEYGFITTREDNPCGFKISYSKKKRRISGSFKVYCAKTEKKLKTYTAKFAGTLGGDLYVTIKKVGSFEASFD